MSRVKHPEWRESHEPTQYPFEDDATLLGSEGFSLLPETFLDAAFYVPGASYQGHISSVVISGDTCTIYVGDEGSTNRASATFSITSPPDVLRFVDSNSRPAGLMVSSSVKLAAFAAWDEGTHQFNYNSAGLVAAVWMPTPDLGVRGIMADDGQMLTGDVYLVGDEGVYLSCDEVTVPAGCNTPEKTFYLIRVDIMGDPLWRRKECAPDSFSTPIFLEKITFQKGSNSFECGPGTNGDVKIHVNNTGATDTILRVRPVDGGLKIEAVGERLEGIR